MACRMMMLLGVTAYPRRYKAAFVTLAFLLVVYSLWSDVTSSAPQTKLAVVFIGMTSNPTPLMTPTRVEVCQGATGLCAVFWVTNISANHIWFKTASVEQRAATRWRPFVPTGGLWSGVEGSLWSPGYGFFYAVGWPPGLDTNATWRLQVRYGRNPSTLGIKVNQKTGWEIFPSGKEESTIPSSKVNQ